MSPREGGDLRRFTIGICKTPEAPAFAGERCHPFVIPAQAGIQISKVGRWIPACAGMTRKGGKEIVRGVFRAIDTSQPFGFDESLLAAQSSQILPAAHRLAGCRQGSRLDRHPSATRFVT
ncbi:MAG: hypothetical protein B7Y36_11305 [Novosphingobium sp. 28-62-57]|nr:MAG: hypothetical protein B7Z34_03530 [Novosphingobium sp. 12-62-10]OYZ09963.1 MAG: hypothetical protein B7Y36_11305 [Novosphingobium sp. 28-62-57]